MQELAAHERVHAENGIMAGKAVRARVSVVEPAPTCYELTERITATYYAVLAKYREADREFDERERRIRLEPETVVRTMATLAPEPLRVPSPAASAAHTGVTDTERYRLAGTAELEAEMAELSEAADRAGEAWRLSVAACPGEIPIVARGGSAGRDWFDYAWTSARVTGKTKDCAAALEFYALADQVKNVICMADERARRAYVYPGTRRDLQTKFHLYWDGWDRACP